MLTVFKIFMLMVILISSVGAISDAKREYTVLFSAAGVLFLLATLVGVIERYAL